MFLLFLFHSPFLSSPFLYFVVQKFNRASTSRIHAIFFLNSPPPALSFWLILYNPFPHCFICHCTQMFYRILSTSIYSIHLVSSVLNPISTFSMWYSLVQPARISSALTVTSLLLEICALLGYYAASRGNFY